MDYDLLRVLSMFSVVYAHTAYGAIWTPESRAIWHIANLLSTFANSSVPIFFMLSGALLLSGAKVEGPADIFQKRLPRILVPLLTWSLLVILLVARGDPEGALTLLRNLSHDPVLVPYWFLYAMIPMYLLIPLLQTLTAHLTPALWRYLLALWGVVVVGFHTVRDLFPMIGLFLKENAAYNLSFLGGYLGYFLLGTALERLQPLPSRSALAAAAMISYLVIAAGTAWTTISSGVYDTRFHAHVNIFMVVLSSSLFLLARSYFSDRESGKGLTFLSSISFGVYLAHPKAINLGYKMWYSLLGGDVIDTIPEHLFFFVVILAACVAGAAIAASIPGVCYLLTGQRFSTACRDGNLFALLHRQTSQPGKRLL